jgi:hypothetical protein
MRAGVDIHTASPWRLVCVLQNRRWANESPSTSIDRFSAVSWLPVSVMDAGAFCLILLCSCDPPDQVNVISLRSIETMTGSASDWPSELRRKILRLLGTLMPAMSS